MVVFRKVVIFGQSECIGEKVVVIVQSGCIQAKWLFSGKIGCIRESGYPRAQWL